MKLIKKVKGYLLKVAEEYCLPHVMLNSSRIRILKFLGVKITGPVYFRKGIKIRIAGGGNCLIHSGVSIGPEVLLDARSGLESPLSSLLPKV